MKAQFWIYAVLWLFVAAPVASAPLAISALRTDRARYLPGQAATLTATLTNPSEKTETVGSLRWTAFFLDHITATGTAASSIRLAPSASRTISFRWQPPRTDFHGYVVAARLCNSAGTTLDTRTTAVDVSSNWAKFLRYGFVSNFAAQSAAASRAEVAALQVYHLNALFFYDWQFQHQTPLAGTVAHPAANWKNIANKTVSRQTVLDLIDAAHQHGMAAMNYNLLYGAWQGYSDDGIDPSWGLWKRPNETDQDKLPMPAGWATPFLYLFDPANPQWQTYLDTQEAKVFLAYPFDGWQVDQVGSPAGNDYDSTGQGVTVWKTFAPFLRAAQTRLHKPLIFNNVGGYGLYDTAAHTQDAAMFIECWPALGQTTYHDLQTIIDQASEWSGGKAVVLAAYMDAAYGDKFAGRAPGQFNLPGVLLTDAAIFASGGDHLELGDGTQMLNNEYYPNHNLVPSPALLTALQRYYDFLVGYENILRSGDGLTPSQNAPTLSVPSSADAQPNTVWTFAKTGPHAQTLQFINLRGENSSAWRDDLADHPAPTVQTNLVVTYHIPTGMVKSVAWASPDSPEIMLHPLKFATGTDARGAFIRFTLPRLAYWDMAYLTTR